MNKDVKFTPFSKLDDEGNFYGGLCIEDDYNDKNNLTKYEYMFITKAKTEEECNEIITNDFKKNGLLNFKRY